MDPASSNGQPLHVIQKWSYGWTSTLDKAQNLTGLQDKQTHDVSLLCTDAVVCMAGKDPIYENPALTIHKSSIFRQGVRPGNLCGSGRVGQ